MDSRIANLPRHQNYEHDSYNDGLRPGSAAEGEDEHSHVQGKKSVLKKVKAKAKKIKDTLKKHDHGHDQDHDHDHEHHRDEQYIPDDHDLDEEDDEDEELMVEDPEVHDGTAVEFAAVRSAIPGEVENLGVEDPVSQEERQETKVFEPIEGIVPGQGLNTGQHMVKSGKPPVLMEEPHSPEDASVSPSPGVNYDNKVRDATKTFVPGEGGSMGQPRVNLERPMGLEEDPHAPKDIPEAHTVTNYQTKVTDPTGTGGEEAAGISPILQSFDKMKVYDEPKPKQGEQEHNLPTTTCDQFTESPTGSHDQFSPEPVPPEAKTIRDKSQLPESSFDTTKLPPDHPHCISETQPNQSSYTEKISSATSAIADKTIPAKNTVASKLEYDEKDMTTKTEVRESGDNAKLASAAEYGKKIAATLTEKLTPLYEKVVGAGSTVTSKVHGTDTGTGNESESGVKGQDKGVSVKDSFLEKLRPGDEDRALAEVIADAIHKPNEEPEKAEMRSVGKVTESEEVARRLGTKEENYGERMPSSDVDSQGGKSVVDKVKGTVGSWFGLRGDQPQPQVPHS